MIRRPVFVVRIPSPVPRQRSEEALWDLLVQRLECHDPVSGDIAYPAHYPEAARAEPLLDLVVRCAREGSHRCLRTHCKVLSEILLGAKRSQPQHSRALPA